jgi:hypothetical protein
MQNFELLERDTIEHSGKNIPMSRPFEYDGHIEFLVNLNKLAKHMPYGRQFKIWRPFVILVKFIISNFWVTIVYIMQIFELIHVAFK